MKRTDEESQSPTDQPGPGSPGSSFRPTARKAFAVGLIATLAGFGMAAYQWRPEPPEVVALREKANANGLQAKMWARYASLSDEGVTSIGIGQLDDYSNGEILSFNHFVPRPRPKDAEQAEEFDHECAAIAAKCRIMQAHYEAMQIKWERAADQRSSNVPPDPAPPLRLEPSRVQDITF